MRKRKYPTHFTCTHCGKENKWSYSSQNKFCNNICQRGYEWENITKPRILRGEGYCGFPMVRFLAERDGYQCSKCSISNWQGKYLRLDIDHIDGNNKNNHPDNIRLLCPNCHRQTETWGNQSSGTMREKIIGL